MTYETKVTRTMRGDLKHETVVRLGVAPADSMNEQAGERVLVLTTMKGYSGITSHASVCVERLSSFADGTRYTTRTSAIFGDYSAVVQRAPQGTRATEKNLAAIHAEALAKLPDIVAACMARYYPEAMASREGASEVLSA